MSLIPIVSCTRTYATYEHTGLTRYVFCINCMEIECSAGANVWLMALIIIETTHIVTSPSSLGKLIV